MAGDWIKMRGGLFSHPKFLSLSSGLIHGENSAGLLAYVCGVDASEKESQNVTKSSQNVTEPSLRDVTLCALLRVWCAVNEHCKVDGDDAVCSPMTVSDVDSIAGFEGFGSALESVGWLKRDEDKSLRFPNFLEFNEPACIRNRPMTNAERQKNYRDRKKGEQERGRDRVTESNGALQRITVDKIREEKNKNTGKRAGVLSLVSQEILADPARVLEWFKTASKGKRRILEPTEGNKINVVALAQRVICDFNVDDPVKVFVACVRDEDFQITGPEEDRAVAAIKLIERGPPPGRSSDLLSKPKSRDQHVRDVKEWGQKRANEDSG